ncbi:MAG: dienelactone hydrolase family protein [Bryobacteraceae bacterium]|nr:dienelactone hydrolase family protein [Solibacteraceae bacterium]MCO5352037.1 dienelactone hydrolase family protein [Bryobacteraceae bacterium]
MDRMKASDFPQEVLRLFDRYAHGEIDRRGFLESAQKYATAGVTAAVMLESLSPNYAWAQQVPKDDARIKTEIVTVESPKGNGSIRGPLSRPANATGKLPGVMVIHENRGLTPYIEDVARRLAVAGFMAFAPDGLTIAGGYPGDEDQARALFPKVDRAKMTEDFEAAARWLKARPDCTGKLGVIGFCFGGAMTNAMAVRLGADMAAGVPYYGGQAPASDVPRIKAALQLHYASLDTRVNAGWPAYEEALKANGVKYTMYMYEGANHAFHNDSTPRYDEQAAKLSWTRVLEFLNQQLR